MLASSADQETGSTFGIVLGAEDGGARHKRVGANLNQLVGIGRGYAAIDLNPGVHALHRSSLSSTAGCLSLATTQHRASSPVCYALLILLHV